jgi:hypothetical protein
LGGTGFAEVRRDALAASTAPPQLQISVLDATGAQLEPRNTRVSISRGLPGDLATLTRNPRESLDAQSVRFVICGPAGGRGLPKTIGIRTTRRSGDVLAVLHDLPLSLVPRADAPRQQNTCVRSPLIRVTADAQDASYAPARDRSLEGELGGYLDVLGPAGVLFSVLVGGPRELEQVRDKATQDRRGDEPGTGILQARLRARIVRTFPGGVPPFGRDDSEAVALLRHEIHGANQLWGQCGITFGDERSLDVAVIDPPAPYLVAIGCGFGVSAAGGHVHFLVDGRLLSVETRPGDVPRVVALRVARAAERLGFRTEVQTNPRMQASALSSFDLEFRGPGGRWATVSPAPGRQVSTDATLGVCIGAVDLANGLDHFTNVSSMTGTLEERTLLRAVIDDDISTIDVVVVEAFSRLGRIGESFIASEAGNLGNIVVLNRAAFRVGARSYALAHELGHIFLDRPGHPDDYGVDTPWNLMDSDAVDGTIFGPKHLTIDDCGRAVAQSGQQAIGTLLTPW